MLNSKKIEKLTEEFISNTGGLEYLDLIKIDGSRIKKDIIEGFKKSGYNTKSDQFVKEEIFYFSGKDNIQYEYIIRYYVFENRNKELCLSGIRIL